MHAISLMPSYCWDRVPPQDVGGTVCLANYYNKLPGLIATLSHKAVYIRFPTWLNQGPRVALTFVGCVPSADGHEFVLLCPETYRALQTPRSRFESWEEGVMEDLRVQNRAAQVVATVRVRILEAPTIDELLERIGRAFDGPLTDETGIVAAAERAADAVAGSYHVASKLVLEWKWRDRPGFRGTSLALPTYNTALADLSPTRSPVENRIWHGVQRVLSDNAAFCATRWGPAWHNSATLGLPW